MPGVRQRASSAVFESRVWFNNNNKKCPKEVHSPEFAKSPWDGSQGNTRGSGNLVNRKSGVTGLTSQWVSGRICGGHLSIGPLWAGVSRRAGLGHCLQLCPDPRTHRNCMAVTLPHRPSLHLFLLMAPGQGEGVGGELGPAAGVRGAPRWGRPEDCLVTFPPSLSPAYPRSQGRTPPTRSTTLRLDLVSPQPFPLNKGTSDPALHPTPCF